MSLKKDFPAYGLQAFRARFCWDRSKRRVVFGGVNLTSVEPNQGGKLLQFRVSDERKGQASILNGRGLLIFNISTVEACVSASCAHRVTTFKVRGYWDGGYQWRVNDTNGQVPGPP